MAPNQCSSKQVSATLLLDGINDIIVNSDNEEMTQSNTPSRLDLPFPEENYWDWELTFEDAKASYWYWPGVGHTKAAQEEVNGKGNGLSEDLSDDDVGDYDVYVDTSLEQQPSNDAYWGWQVAHNTSLDYWKWQQSYSLQVRINDSLKEGVNPEELKKSHSGYWNWQETINHVMGRTLSDLSHTPNDKNGSLMRRRDSNFSLMSAGHGSTGSMKRSNSAYWGWQNTMREMSMNNLVAAVENLVDEEEE